jgi:hypothetical protein
MWRPTRYEPDARLDGWVVEVKSGSQSANWVRGGLLQLARLLDEEPATRGLLVLVEPRMSVSRILDELAATRRVLRKDLQGRLFVSTWREGELQDPPRDSDPRLEEVVRDAIARAGARGGPQGGVAWLRVLQVLVHRWLLGRQPTSVATLRSLTGFSQPTVASALDRLAHVLVRSSDRSVSLLRFPRAEWDQLVASSDLVRRTRRFVDRSGKPRSPDALLRRLSRLDRPDVAIGGVVGAQHHLPSLDVVGAPRVDLSLHAPRDVADLSFVAALDPALGEAKRRDETPTLVVHLVRRADPLFTNARGRTWADPTECLLDLQEMGLETQASQLLRETAARQGHEV